VTTPMAAAGRARRVWRERLIYALLWSCAAVSVLTTAGIIWVLVSRSLPFFGEVSPWAFLTGTRWQPDLGEFGVLPLVLGTAIVAVGALLVSLPIGVATAIYLSEYASTGVRQVFKPVLEVLAGIPSIVYGFFALSFVTPVLLQPLIPGTDFFNAASAAIVVGIMVIPMITSLCDDAFRAVPRSLRDGAYALAATRLEVSTRVVLPAAASGVAAAVLLAFARAIGETMAVAIAAGMRPSMSVDPRKPVQTMTGYIVSAIGGERPADSPAYQSLFVVGLSLFAVTITINLIAQLVLRRYREAYE
jgi:phosphate transport system permease protein